MNLTLSRRPARLLLVVVALALTGLVAACGASETGDDSASSSSASSADVAGSSVFESAPDVADDAAKDAATDTSAQRTADGTRAVVDSAKAVISTGNVSLRAADVEALLFDVQKAVDRYRGEVSERSSQSDDAGQVTRSRLVLRVPATSFGDLMGALEETGTLVSSDSQSEDVTAQVIDNQVRVSVQKASIDRIRALLAQAADIKDVVSIEAELSTRQADLDSLEQTQAYLADQTSMSTITVSVEQTEAARPRKDDDSGFLAGLSAGWDALSGFGNGAATLAGALLPWLVVAGVLAVPGVALTRRLRRRTTDAVGT